MDIKNYYHQVSADETDKMPAGMIRSYSSQEQVSDEEKVLKEITKILGAVRRRIPVIIGVAAICTAGLLFKLSQKPPTFKGSFQLLVEPVTSAENRLQSILTQTEGSQRETLNTKDFTLDYGTLLWVLKSPKVMSPIYESITEKYPKYNPTRVKVERPFNESEGTRILEVSYSGKTENEVQFVLEKLAAGYLEYKKKDRQTNLRRGIIFIEEQTPELQERVNLLQGEIRRLREQYDVMIPEVLGSKLQDQQRAVEMRQLDNEIKLTEARAAYSTIKTLFEQENYVAILGQEAGTYGSFIVQTQNTDIELTEASARLEAEHPTIKVLREKQQELEIIARKKSRKYPGQTCQQYSGTRGESANFSPDCNRFETTTRNPARRGQSV